MGIHQLLKRRPQRGFTYVFVLFFVAITAAALAALGQAWSTAVERERERELEFRGGEIARAILSYQKAIPARPESPHTLDDLLEDRRTPKPRHHLRQRYVDPFTGKADWVLLADAADRQRFSGVRSASEHLLLRTRRSDGQAVRLASDWEFRANDFEAGQPFAAPASAPAQGATHGS